MEVKLRKDIKKSDKWKLEDIYKNEKEWKQEYENIKNSYNEILKFKGKLNNKRDILDCYNLSISINSTLEKLYVYAFMRLDQDLSNSLYQGLKSKINSLIVEISTACSFIDPEMNENSAEFLEQLSKDKDMSNYSYSLELLAKRKKHCLSDKEEMLLAQSSSFSSLFKDAFMMFDNVDVKFDSFINDEGEEVKLSHGIYGLYMRNQVREDRKSAFESMFNAYKNNINTISTLYIGNVKKDVFYSKVRNYNSCLERACLNEDVPTSVYERLIKCIHSNLKYLHEYMSYRKKDMHLDEMHMYDLHVPIVKNAEINVPYKEACNIVREALMPLGQEYQGLLNRAFTEGWIDVYENKGKRSGAYSCDCYGVHPYVLLNYTESTSEIFTIAHELGHAMHSYYSDLNQPKAKADYEIFVAEVASTVNETLLAKHLLKNATGKDKKFLLSYLLDMFRTTVFRQSQFAEFEDIAHKTVEEAKPISSDVLNNIYYNLNKKYYGPDVVSDDLIKYEWARIPHFYNSYYVYKYSTGLISAVCIADDILKKGESAVKKYKKFLSAGGSMSPIEILKLVDVDLTTSRPYNKAMNFYKSILEEIKSLED